MGGGVPKQTFANTNTYKYKFAFYVVQNWLNVLSSFSSYFPYILTIGIILKSCPVIVGFTLIMDVLAD